MAISLGTAGANDVLGPYLQSIEWRYHKKSR
jgi:hypothetical protein